MVNNASCKSSRRSRAIPHLVNQHAVEAWYYLWLLKRQGSVPYADARFTGNNIVSTRNDCIMLHFTDYLYNQLCWECIASYLFTRYYCRHNSASNSMCVSYFVYLVKLLFKLAVVYCHAFHPLRTSKKPSSWTLQPCRCTQILTRGFNRYGIKVTSSMLLPAYHWKESGISRSSPRPHSFTFWNRTSWK